MMATVTIQLFRLVMVSISLRLNSSEVEAELGLFKPLGSLIEGAKEVPGRLESAVWVGPRIFTSAAGFLKIAHCCGDHTNACKTVLASCQRPATAPKELIPYPAEPKNDPGTAI